MRKLLKNESLTREERKVIFLSSLGGALEFYDFIIYVFFASTLGHLFFPTKNHLASLIGVFAVFAVGYLIRPLGGVLLSHFGDTYGRKKTFVSTLLLMALPTFLIGLLPTYNQVGVWAAIGLTFLRLLQGLSVGGEIPGAITFASEHVKPDKRGLTCSFIFFGINTGMLLGSLVSVLMTNYLSPEALLNWGWRIPFLLGGLLGVVSFYLRKRMAETPIFQAFYLKEEKRIIPFLKVIREHFPEVIQSIGLACLGAVVICLLFLFIPTYLSSILHYPKGIIESFNTINMIFFSFALVSAGWLSDTMGRRIFLLIGSIGFMTLGYALFFLLTRNNLPLVMMVMILISLLSACIVGVYPCVLIELFPTPVRYTGMAVSYNMSFGIFGGLSPLIATYLIHQTGNVLAPSFYLTGSAICCFIAALFLKNQNKKQLI